MIETQGHYCVKLQLLCLSAIRIDADKYMNLESYKNIKFRHNIILMGIIKLYNYNISISLFQRVARYTQ